jgi:hypothetical protein
MVNNEDDNNQPHLTCKFSLRNLFTHRLVAFAVLRKTGIGSVFVINFSLRNIEDGTKTFVKTNKTRTLVFPSVATELSYKDVVMRWVVVGRALQVHWATKMEVILVPDFQPRLHERNCFKERHNSVDDNYPVSRFNLCLKSQIY